jgi:hypothetical protein
VHGLHIRVHVRYHLPRAAHDVADDVVANRGDEVDEVRDGTTRE